MKFQPDWRATEFFLGSRAVFIDISVIEIFDDFASSIEDAASDRNIRVEAIVSFNSDFSSHCYQFGSKAKMGVFIVTLKRAHGMGPASVD